MSLFPGPFLDAFEIAGNPARNRSMQNALNAFYNGLSGADLTALERVGLTVAELSLPAPDGHVWAGHRHQEVFYAASLLKIVPMVAAEQLLAAARELLENLLTQPATADAYFALMSAKFDQQIRDRTPNRIKNTPAITDEHLLPKYRTLFTVLVNSSGRPTGLRFSDTFRAQLEPMIVDSSASGALACVHAVGYGYMAGLMADLGFWLDLEAQGVWLAADYNQVWPAVRVPSANDPTTAQGCSTVQLAGLLARLHERVLVGTEASTDMRDLLGRAGHWFHNKDVADTDWVWPPSSDFRVTRGKVGIGPLQGNPRPAISEGIIVHQFSTERNFVAAYANLLGPETKENLTFAARAIEAAIKGFRP